MVEFTTVGIDTSKVLLKMVNSASSPSLLTTMKLQVINSTEAVHVRLRRSPTQHTGATVIGDNVNIPAHTKIMYAYHEATMEIILSLPLTLPSKQLILKNSSKVLESDCCPTKILSFAVILDLKLTKLR